jgi:hypothetical protein
LVLLSAPAFGEGRYALIIGNGAYENVDPLPNPTNDVRLVSESLEAVGFNVTLLVDATKRQMDDATRQFARTLDDAGRNTVGVFYFAGHGVTYEGENWLIPLGADIQEGVDIEYAAVSANRILKLMEGARNATDILILDACRNSPFRGFSLSGTRAVTRGLSRMDAPAGSFIAYSTAPGAVAYDGAGSYSPFAEAFAAEVMMPNVSIGDMMIDVRNRVKASTQALGNSPQTPWDASSLTGRFYFNPGLALARTDVALDPLPENDHAAGRGMYRGDSFVLESKEGSWLAWKLVRDWISGDFHARATIRMTNARVPESVAGLVFDSSEESDSDLAIGAVFIGKRARDLVISTKAASDRFDILYEARGEVSGDASDVIEIERIGTRYRFIVNNDQVATWNEPATMRGALKLYVWDGYVEMRDWAIETIGTN